MSQHQMLAYDEYHTHNESIYGGKGLDRYPCQCKDCCVGKMKKLVIYLHMIRYGHSGIISWDKNNYLDMVESHNMRNEKAPNIDEDATKLDKGFEVDRMLNEGLNSDWNKLMEDALKPMYGTCKLIHFTTILEILNFQVLHAWAFESVDELLALPCELLPAD